MLASSRLGVTHAEAADSAGGFSGFQRPPSVNATAPKRHWPKPADPPSQCQPVPGTTRPKISKRAEPKPSHYEQKLGNSTATTNRGVPGARPPGRYCGPRRSRQAAASSVGRPGPPASTARRARRSWPQASEQPGTPAASPLDAGGLHAAEFVFEVLDLIPDSGGDLELQLGRGGMHLVGELPDQRDQVAPGLAAAFGSRTGRTGRAGRGRLARPRRKPRHRRLAPALLAPPTAEELLGVGVLPDQLVEDVGDPLAQRRRVDAVLAVVGDLLLAPPVRLVDGPLHGRG